MRTLNVRLAVILVVILVVFGVGVYFVHAGMLAKNKTVFLDEAKKAQDDMAVAKKEKDFKRLGADFENAYKYWNWYLRLAPWDTDRLQEYGMMLADAALDPHLGSGGLVHSASETLETVVRRDPDNTSKARRQLVKMLMLPFMHRITDAQQHLVALLKESPTDPELLQWRGYCSWQTQKDKEACETFRKSIQYGKGQLEAYEQLAHLLRSPRLNKPNDQKEADDWMLKLVQNNPQSAKAHFIRARYLAMFGMGAEARKEADAAVALSPDDADFIRLAAELNLSQRKLDAARKLAEHGIKLYPDSASLYLVLARVIEGKEPQIDSQADPKLRAQQVAEAQVKQRAEALTVLEQGIKSTLHSEELLVATAQALIISGKLDKAQPLVDELKTVAPGHKFRADYLTGQILLEKHDWLRAAERLERAREAMATLQPAAAAQIDLWLGECYRQLGDPDEQIRRLRQAVKTDTTGDSMSIRSKLQLADALRRQGNIDGALELVTELLKNYPRGAAGASILVLYADLAEQKLLRLAPERRNWTPVARALDEAVKDLPDEPRIPMLRAQMLGETNRFEEAEAVVLKAQKKHPKEASYWLARVALAERQSDWTKAEKLLLEARDKNPEEVIYWLRLADLAQRQHDWAKQEKTLSECQAKLGDSVRLRLERMRFVLGRYQAEEKEKGKVGKEDRDNRLRQKLHEFAENSKSFSDSDKILLFGMLSDVARQTDDNAQADLLSKRITELQPNDVQVRQVAFDRALAAGNVKTADKALEEYKKVAGPNYYWHYAQALMLIQRATGERNPAATLDLALEQLATARQLRKDWTKLSLAEGMVYQMQGKPDQA